MQAEVASILTGYNCSIAPQINIQARQLPHVGSTSASESDFAHCTAWQSHRMSCKRHRVLRRCLTWYMQHADPLPTLLGSKCDASCRCYVYSACEHQAHLAPICKLCTTHNHATFLVLELSMDWNIVCNAQHLKQSLFSSGHGTNPEHLDAWLQWHHQRLPCAQQTASPENAMPHPSQSVSQSNKRSLFPPIPMTWTMISRWR